MKLVNYWIIVFVFITAIALPVNAETSPDSEGSKFSLFQSAVVGVQTQVPQSARTARFLGSQREGTGIVISKDNLVVTIGYLMLEAQSAEIVDVDGRILPASIIGYDASSGLGLLQALAELKAAPLPLGNSSQVQRQDTLQAVSRSGTDEVVSTQVVVAERDTFAGYWEYLLENAIFTIPAIPDFAGSALVNENGQLIGVGSLFLREFFKSGSVQIPGNMFVPIDELKPIMTDMLEQGRRSAPPRPWLGVNVSEQYGRVIVNRVVSGGPASQVGLEEGDLILKINSTPVDSLETLFRTMWGAGEAGVDLQLTVVQRNTIREVQVKSADRYQHYQFSHLN